MRAIIWKFSGNNKYEIYQEGSGDLFDLCGGHYVVSEVFWGKVKFLIFLNFLENIGKLKFPKQEAYYDAWRSIGTKKNICNNELHMYVFVCVELLNV